MRIAIIGRGVVGNLAALYFRRRLPDNVEIIQIGPDDRGGLPLVGESIIEITAHFLETHLGMAEYLRENHLPKYALTYYFKLDPENPDDRTYSVHCNERGPVDRPLIPGWEGPMAQPPSWLLNRHTFDRYLNQRIADEPGIRCIRGRVKDVELDRDAGHSLEIKTQDGSSELLKTDWVIDASGRKRLLANKLDLTVRPEGQRDCFWFRVRDFDRSLLSNLNALGPMPPGPGEPYHYERYYSTHHFMGKGNWIWMIPQKGEDGSDQMSIGLVSHPDHYEYDVRSMEGFYEHVGRVHPVVTEFVRSGEVIDTNLLRRYHYVTRQYYSTDRWGIVGDAAFAPDPLFSNGLAFGTIQLEQLGEILAQDCAGELSQSYVDLLNKGFTAPVLSSQTAISNWYATMDDAYLSSLRLNWIEVVYFYMFLPLTINRCHFEPGRIKYWNVMRFRSDANNFEIPQTLVDARARLGKPCPEVFIYKGKEKVNLRALEVLDEMRGIEEQIREGQHLLQAYTDETLARIEQLSDAQSMPAPSQPGA